MTTIQRRTRKGLVIVSIALGIGLGLHFLIRAIIALHSG